MLLEESKAIVRRYWAGRVHAGHLGAGRTLGARLRVATDVMLVAALLAAFGVAYAAPNSNNALTATLDGAPKPDGPPTAKDPDGSGTAIIRVNADKGEVCWELTVAGIAPAFAAHIHYVVPQDEIRHKAMHMVSPDGCVGCSLDLRNRCSFQSGSQP